MVNGRAYTIACDDGEEDHLRELAAHVDAKVREVMETVGQVGDQRLLLMAALLLPTNAMKPIAASKCARRNWATLRVRTKP